MRKEKFTAVPALFAAILATGILAGCSDSGSNRNNVPPPVVEPAPEPAPEPVVTPTVSEALADYPDVLISDFSVSYPQVRGEEIFKRVDFRDNAEGTAYWGIEGLSSDETLEIEAIFTTELSLHEEGRGNILDELPAEIEDAFAALYPNGKIEELASSLEDGEVAYAILFILDGEELEVNLDATGDFDSLENVLEDDEVPQTIRDVIEAQNVDMPEVEYEEVTHADDSVSYVVEYENDEGESISYKLNADGEILQIDWEGPLPASFETDTVAEALAGYPNSVVKGFTQSHPEVMASEVFKRIDYRDDPEGVTYWGIEGLSADETLEVESVFTIDLSLHEEGQGNLLEALPADILSAFDALYPDTEIEEMASSMEDGQIAYAVLFVQDGREYEVNLDANGEFDSLENVLEDEEIPDQIRGIAEAQNVDMPDVEYEEVIHADDSISYVVEFENDDGESISYKISAEAKVLQIDWEAPIDAVTGAPTVGEALSDFPDSIIDVFAEEYPQVSAAEIFMRIDYRGNSEGTVYYGIEGLSDDETLEIEAVFTADVNLLEVGEGRILEQLPGNILAAFEALYPGADIDEMASSEEDGEIAYAILFLLDGEELEVNLDANGEFESLENVLEENEVPDLIRKVAEAQGVDMPYVEFEEVTHADTSISYVVEFENDEDESVSYKITSDGEVLQADFEGPI